MKVKKIVMVLNKMEEDWKEYERRELARTKEEVFGRSYNNAVAGEWIFFFREGFADYADDLGISEKGKVFGLLLGLENAIVNLTDYVTNLDYMEFSLGEFEAKLEEYVSNHTK